jgi:DNA relaxase NicK
MLASILENTWSNGGKVTRIDFALDDKLGRTNPRDAMEYIKRGEMICRAKQYPINQDVRGGGFTQYLGRMASEVHVCIYEKDAEQGITGFKTRVEIRFKGSKANKAARQYLQSEDCRGLISGFVRFPSWDAWNEVFATKPIKVLAEKTDSKRVRWLLTQVAKSMALEIAERQGDLQILELFEIKVREYLSDLRHTTE